MSIEFRDYAYFFKKETKMRSPEEMIIETINNIKYKYIDTFIEVIKKPLKEDQKNKDKFLKYEDRIKINNSLGINIDKVANFLEINSQTLLQELEKQKNNHSLKVVFGNSLDEIFLNAAANGGPSLNWLIKKSAEKIELLKLTKDERFNQIIGGLKIIFEYLPYYIQEILEKKEKLKNELESNNGYVEKFSDHIKDISQIRTSSLRILLFYLFSKLEKEHSSNEDFLNNFLEESKRLITGGVEQYLNLNKIREDIKNGNFVKN